MARNESLNQGYDLVRFNVSALRTIMHTSYNANHHIYFPHALAKVAASDLQNDPTARACGAIDTHSFDNAYMSDDIRPLFCSNGGFSEVVLRAPSLRRLLCDARPPMPFRTRRSSQSASTEARPLA